MRKVSVFLCLFMAIQGLFPSSVFAQISTGEPNSSIIPRTGNRPQKGDFGMYLGGTVNQVLDLIDLINSEGAAGCYGIPVVNLKYYCSDKWEVRMGFQFAARTQKEKTVTTSLGENEEIITRNNEGANYTRFLPGVAYHFSASNLLDVYLGAQMPIGFNTSSSKNEIDNQVTSTRQGAFVIGAGLFGGVQFFIADLPIAIGLELGYSGQVVSESIPVHTIKTSLTNQKYKEGTGTVSAKWGADAALTFSYYFH